MQFVQKRVNQIQAEEEASGSAVDCNFIDVEYDREPEYSVLQLESAIRINSIETPKSHRGKPRSISIQLRSGPSSFYSTVDTGRPVSFLNKRTCDLILQRNPSLQFRDVTRYPIGSLYVDYNKRPTRLLGSLRIPVSSHGWKVEDALFLISENKTRNPLGLDLHEKLGLVTAQLKAEHVLLLEDEQQDPVSEYWRSYFAQRYAHVFNRLGRSKSHKFFTSEKSKFPILFKDRVAKEIKI